VYDAAAGKFPAFLRLQGSLAETRPRRKVFKVFEGVGTAAALGSVLPAAVCRYLLHFRLARGQAARTKGEMA